MHATQVPRPFHTKGWVYEEKYDGWRMLAVKEAGRVRLISRNGRDRTKRFHAIAEALAALKPKTLTLDGRIRTWLRWEAWGERPLSLRSNRYLPGNTLAVCGPMRAIVVVARARNHRYQTCSGSRSI